MKLDLSGLEFACGIPNLWVYMLHGWVRRCIADDAQIRRFFSPMALCYAGRSRAVWVIVTAESLMAWCAFTLRSIFIARMAEDP